MRALPALLLFAMACSPATAPARTPVHPVAAAAPAPADDCPLALDGATVEVKEGGLGSALEFTSYGDVAELRRRVRLLGDVDHPTGHHRYVEDVDGGARIVFPSGLRPELAVFAQTMEGGACPVTLPNKPEDVIVTR